MRPLAALPFFLCASALVAQETPVFRATTELVLVDVQVIHKKMKTAAPPLEQQHFQIYEDGALRDIKSFSRDELPLSVVLLFDLTDSVRPVLKRLARGARAALDHLKPKDEVAVMTYAASATVVDGFTIDRERTLAAIERAADSEANEAAFFNEAVYQAAEQLRQTAASSNRRVVIWLTDNLPNVPSEWMRKQHGGSVAEAQLHTQDDAVRALHESGTTVAPLLLKNMATLPFYMLSMATEAPWYHKYPPGDAKKYAERTGGEAMGLGGKQVEMRLADLIDELRSRYTIGFQPSTSVAPGTFCKLRVELAPKGPLRQKEWKVLATAGYYRK